MKNKAENSSKNASKIPAKRGIKARLKSGLKTALVGGAVALSALLPSKANADMYYSQATKEFLNPFVRPDITQTNYYGSGDADNDRDIDYDDLNLIKSNQYTNPDWADVSGNGIVESEDESLLESYLNKEIPYLPGNWNNLKTREERKSWIEKIIAIDDTNEDILKKLYNYGWECTDFEWDFFKNNYGVKDIPSTYKFRTDAVHKNENNGRFNLPLYGVRVWNKELNFDHAIDAILIGDNPLDFNDWYFIEPQNDSEVKPGDWSMPEDCRMDINVYHGFDNKTNDFIYDFLVGFDITEGVPYYAGENRGGLLVTKRPSENPTSVAENNDTKPLELRLNQNYPNPFNSGTSIPYELQSSGNVELNIYDVSGRKIETLVNENQQAGSYTVNWDASKYASGTYLYQLRTGDGFESKRMIHVK